MKLLNNDLAFFVSLIIFSFNILDKSIRKTFWIVIEVSINMGLFDYFTKPSEEFSSSGPSSSFSSKIVRIVCQTNEEGIRKCKKFTESNGDKYNSEYESTEEEFESPGFSHPNFENDLSDFSDRLKLGFGMFGSMFNELENLSRFMNEFSDFNEFSQQNNEFQNFERPHFRTNERKQETNIFDV